MSRLVISQNERLLLHLLELDRYREEADVPMLVCQEGIAEQLGTQVHNASRSLSSLQAGGLVESRLAHVRGAPRRRRAYFLTAPGRAAAEAIRADLMGRTIAVRGPGGTMDMTVREALAAWSRFGLNLSSIVDLARQEDVVDTPTERPEAVSVPARPISRSLGRPRAACFFGREAELGAVRDALARDDPLVLVWGLPGIGKSALASKLFEELEGQRPVFWHTVKEWDTSASMMKGLLAFLKAGGRGEASRERGRSRELHDIFPALVEDLAALKGVIFLDDVHKATGEARSAIAMLTEAGRAKGGSSVVLIARSIPGFVSVGRPDTLTVQLEGLDDRSAEVLARSLGPPDLGRVLEQGHRHPLIIQLIAKGSTFTGPSTVTSFIEGEISMSVSPEERRALELLSIYREPVGLDALPDVSADTITSLRRQGLVLEGEEGLAVHEVLREHFLARINAETLAALHQAAARYYERSSDGVVEAIYHWLGAGEEGAAIELFLGRAEEALEEPQEVLALTASFRSPDTAQRAAIRFWRGEAFCELSRFQEALEEYTASVEADLLPKELAGRAYGGIAQAQKETGQWKESLSSHQKALDEYVRRGDRASQAREWLSIGSVHRRMGDRSRAQKAYEQAIELAGGAPRVRAASLNNQALLAWEGGSMDRAEELFKSSLRLANMAGDHAGEARTMRNLIELFRADYRLDEVRLTLIDSAPLLISHLDDGELYDLVGPCATALATAGRMEEAVATVEGLVQGCSPARARNGAKEARLLLVLSRTLRKGQRYEGCLEAADRGLRASKGGDDPQLRAKLLLEKAMAMEGMDRLGDARDVLSEAEDALRRAQVLPGQMAVTLRRGMVEERMGDRKRAADLYRQASLQAERLDDRLALARSSEGLGRVLDPGAAERGRALRKALDIYLDMGMTAEAEELRVLVQSD